MRPGEHEHRHWFTLWAFAIASGWTAGAYLWPLGQTTHGEFACVASCVLWLVSAQCFVRGLRAYDYAAEMRRLRKLSSAISTVHGSSRTATLKDLRARDMLKPGGLFVGRAFGKDIWSNAVHSMVISPPGGSKGVSVLLPNLLVRRGPKNPKKREPSIIVVDPKAENCVCSRRFRSRFSEIVTLNPFREKMHRELGVDLGDRQFNPLGFLKSGPDVKDDAALIASFLIPGRAQMTESEAFFVSSGRAILTGAMLHLLSESPSDTITLPQLRRALMVDVEELERFLSMMATSPAYAGVVEEYGKRFVAAKENNSRQFEASWSTASDSLEIYDGFGSLGQHVSGGDFSFEECKQRPITVYIILPGDRLGTHAAWINLVLSVAMEQVGRDRSIKPVRFFIDEISNLGFMPSILRNMALYRSNGVFVSTFWQAFPSQAQRIYKDGWKEFAALSELIQIFGVHEAETLKWISEWIGNTTVRDVSHSSHSDTRFDGGQDVSLSAVDRARPLFQPSEVRALAADEQLVMFRNMPVLRATLVSYLKERRLRRRADPNPYYRRRTHRVV